MHAMKWKLVHALCAALAVWAVALPALAEDGDADAAPRVKLLGPGPGDEMAPDAPEGMSCTKDELRAWKLATEARALAEAREAAEQLLARNPDSYVAQYILGYAHHYGEGNLPRAVYFMEEAIETMRDLHGQKLPPQFRLWEARALVSLGRAQTQLGEFEEAIETYREHDKRFPQELPEKISTVWPLMQLRRFDEALKVSHDVLRDPRTETNDRAVALNGYTAVLFEKGERREAHKWAMQLTTEFPQSPTFWANASETARGLFQLGESERLALESAKRGVSDYAQPWIDVADLRVRGGKLYEGFQALLQDRSYRTKRPPYLEQQGAASAQRTVAMLMMLMNDSEAASNLTWRAIVQPDRSGGKSRDIRQDLATSALLDFRIRTDRAMQLTEQADLLGGLRLSTRYEAWSLGYEADTSAARSRSVLHDNELLIGMISVGGPYGVVLPPWLVPELKHVVGPGVFYNAVNRAREIEFNAHVEDILGPYFDAFTADAELALGDEDAAERHAKAALNNANGLPEGETLLRLRMEAILVRLYLDEGNVEAAIPRLDRILATDPGLLRRLDVALPLAVPDDAAGANVANILLGSDRYAESSVGYRPEVSGDTICLRSPTGARTSCATQPRGDDMSDEDHLFARVLAFHDAVFRPDTRIDLMALRALDGSSITPSGGNKGLRTILDGDAPNTEKNEKKK